MLEWMKFYGGFVGLWFLVILILVIAVKYCSEPSILGYKYEINNDFNMIVVSSDVFKEEERVAIQEILVKDGFPSAYKGFMLNKKRWDCQIQEIHAECIAWDHDKFVARRILNRNQPLINVVKEALDIMKTPLTLNTM